MSGIVSAAAASLVLLLSLGGRIALSKENSLKDVCLNATNNAWNSDGFVCVTEYSHFYVSCNKTEDSACFLRCPTDTRCSEPIGEFVSTNPCSKSYCLAQ